VGVFLENRQEAALLVQQRDRWTSDVAHELKTPLTSIRLVAETLQPRVDDSQRRWLDRLINETIRLSNLVEDLLNLSRLQGDQFRGSPSSRSICPSWCSGPGSASNLWPRSKG
jgi:two-component system phosphate regulon sensor histidine kinase PhoR